MDVVAGKEVLETEVKQHSARFKLDYSQVHRTTCNPLHAVLKVPRQADNMTHL